MLCIHDLMLLSHVYYDALCQCCFHRCNIWNLKLKKTKIHILSDNIIYYWFVYVKYVLSYLYFAVHVAEGGGYTPYNGMTLYNIYNSNFWTRYKRFATLVYNTRTFHL